MKSIAGNRTESTRRSGRGAAARAWVAISVAVAAVAAFGCAKAPEPVKVEMTLEQKIARGKQISYTSACHDCHSPGGLYGAPDTTRMLSGSELGWEGPWGVSFPRNLTPDMETGIGSWSEEDIVTAIRTGIRPDHTPLMPPMPWPMYAHLSDEDAHALAAFLKSLPPVVHKMPDRIPPGTAATVARVTFPPPPAWDAQNLPKPQ
ncbi:MAG TPA: cytochrome c [Candidatus Eisenbacteria bacterium]|nr:cytochrome c [Candidatus Eisenbacteria bacterium]